MSDGTHACPWPGCTQCVPRHLWGCKAHWYRLPRDLRERCAWAWRYGTFADHVKVLEEIDEWLSRQQPAPTQESLL